MTPSISAIEEMVKLVDRIPSHQDASITVQTGEEKCRMQQRTRYSKTLSSLTYSTDGTEGSRVFFATIILLAFFVPTVIVAIQWLFPTEGVNPSSDPIAVLIGAALMLWPIWQMGYREYVTIDRRNRTISWTLSIFKIALKTVTWSWDEARSVEVGWNAGNFQVVAGCNATVTGTKGRRFLLSYFHSPDRLPESILETVRMLGFPIQLPK